MSTVGGHTGTSGGAVILPRSVSEEAFRTTRGILGRSVTGVVVVNAPRRITRGDGKLSVSGTAVVSPFACRGARSCVGLFIRLEGTGKLACRRTGGATLKSCVCCTYLVIGTKSTSNIISKTYRSATGALEPDLRVVGAGPKIGLISTFFLVIIPSYRCNTGKTFVFTSDKLRRGPSPRGLTTVTTYSTRDFRLLIRRRTVITVLSRSAVKDTGRTSISGIIRTAEVYGRTRPRLGISKRLRLSTTVIPSIKRSGTPGDGITNGTGILMFPSLSTNGVNCGLIRELTGTRTCNPMARNVTVPVGSLSHNYDTSSVINIITVATIRTRTVGGWAVGGRKGWGRGFNCGHEGLFAWVSTC